MEERKIGKQVSKTHFPILLFNQFYLPAAKSLHKTRVMVVFGWKVDPIGIAIGPEVLLTWGKRT